VAKKARRKRAIYHYRRALDQITEAFDGFPLRLFTLMFPLHRVHVRGHVRGAEEYAELEWLIVRAIAHTGMSNTDDLSAFFGLEETLVKEVVYGLEQIGHLSEDEQGQLSLTFRGNMSLADEQRYEEYDSRQVLYFDAYTSRPLPHTHYRLRFFETTELEDRDRALYSPNSWEPGSLEALLRRLDRTAFNVPNEVQSMFALRVDRAFLPLHVVEVIVQDGKRELRTFSNVRGYRDHFFEMLLSENGSIIHPLMEDGREAEKVIERSLRWYQLTPGMYQLGRGSRGEWRVTVAREWLHSVRPGGVKRLADLGEYVLASDYCVMVWSDNADLRQWVACDKVLDRLEHIPGEQRANEISRQVDRIFARLEVPPVDIDRLLEMAHKQGQGRAQERLEQLVR
jgi:hypothetical protein